MLTSLALAHMVDATRCWRLLQFRTVSMLRDVDVFCTYTHGRCSAMLTSLSLARMEDATFWSRPKKMKNIMYIFGTFKVKLTVTPQQDANFAFGAMALPHKIHALEAHDSKNHTNTTFQRPRLRITRNNICRARCQPDILFIDPCWVNDEEVENLMNIWCFFKRAQITIPRQKKFWQVIQNSDLITTFFWSFFVHSFHQLFAPTRHNDQEHHLCSVRRSVSLFEVSLEQTSRAQGELMNVSLIWCPRSMKVRIWREKNAVFFLRIQSEKKDSGEESVSLCHWFLCDILCVCDILIYRHTQHAHTYVHIFIYIYIHSILSETKNDRISRSRRWAKALGQGPLDSFSSTTPHRVAKG